MIEIVNKSECVGCNACELICPIHCISTYRDNEGFAYPKVDKKKCINCHLCEKVCPIIHSGIERKPYRIDAGVSKEGYILNQSSSGGIFSEIAIEVIKEGGVVFGAFFKDDFSVHIGYTNIVERLSQFRGSKYVQSNTGNSFIDLKTILDKGIPVLYSGTPCQIRALHNFLGKKYVNLFTMDFICHGVPSPEIWKKYFNFITSDKSFKDENGNMIMPNEKIIGVSFRDKHISWRKFMMSITTAQGTKYYSNRNNNLYMRAFLNDIILRPCCYSCKFKNFKSGSDITMGDFWGIENTILSTKIENISKGVSCIFTNSKKGYSLLSKANLDLLPTEMVDVQKENPSVCKPVKIPNNRIKFFSYLQNNDDVLFALKKYGDVPLKIKIRSLIIKSIKKIGLLGIIRKAYGKK